MAKNGLSLLMNKPSIPEIMEDEEKAKFDRTIAQAEALRMPSMFEGVERSPAAAPIVVKTPIDEKITTKVTESAIPQATFNQLAEVFSGSKKQVSQLASDATKTLTQVYRDMSALESAEKSKSAEKIQAALEKIEKGSDKEMTNGQMFARLLIGLAPQLIGAAAGKAMGIGYGAGGAAGGAAALAGLQQLKEQEKEAKERGDKVAQTKLKVLIEQEEARLKPYTEATQQSLKNLLDVPVLEMKTEASLAAQGVPLAARAIIEGAEREKTTVQERKGEKATVVKPSAGKGAGEKGSDDLGFGIKLRPDANKKDRENAQKIVSKYGPVDSAFDDVISELERADIRSVTKWSDAGKNLASKVALLANGLISYTNRGASLTKNEKSLVDDLGISLEGDGSVSEKFRIALEPKALAARLKQVKSAVRKGAISQAITYRAYDSLAPEQKPAMSSEQRKARLKEIEERMKFLKKGAQ